LDELKEFHGASPFHWTGLRCYLINPADPINSLCIQFQRVFVRAIIISEWSGKPHGSIFNVFPVAAVLTALGMAALLIARRQAEKPAVRLPETGI
jgi:hypothetical protein